MTTAAAPAPRALSGSLPALVTPLTDPTTLDLAGVGTLVRAALDEGASGVLVAGTTGEGSLLEPQQRVAVTAAARRAVDAAASPGGADPVVVAGASGPSLGAVHADVARLAAAGADLVLVLPPSLQPLTPDEVADLHLAVAERAEVDLLAYHIPQLTGSPLTAATVRRIAVHERIVGMKDSSPDAERRAGFIAATREVAGFSVLTGHAPTLARALADGIDGSILAASNLRLRHAVAAATAAADGDTDRVATLQARLTALTRAIGEVGASVPAVLKAALQLDGRIAERWCTPPLASVPGNRLDAVRTAMLR